MEVVLTKGWDSGSLTRPTTMVKARSLRSRYSAAFTMTTEGLSERKRFGRMDRVARTGSKMCRWSIYATVRPHEKTTRQLNMMLRAPATTVSDEAGVGVATTASFTEG